MAGSRATELKHHTSSVDGSSPSTDCIKGKINLDLTVDAEVVKRNGLVEGATFKLVKTVEGKFSLMLQDPSTAVETAFSFSPSVANKRKLKSSKKLIEVNNKLTKLA